MQIVARSPVQLEPRPAAVALTGALTRAAGRPPLLSLVRFLLAQIWFETAGRPNNGNFGNLMAASLRDGQEISTWPGLAWRPGFFSPGPGASADELASHAAMVAGKEPSAFRAYPPGPAGLEQGLLDYLSVLAHRFPDLLRAGEAGDVDAFARAYVSSGYCPRCSPDSVRRNILARLDELTRAGAFVGLDVRGPGPGGSGPAIALVAATVAAVLFWLTTRPLPPRKGKAA